MTNEAMVKMVANIDFLRADEGDSVSLFNDSTEYNGQPIRQPSSLVECCGEWTKWETRRFTGDSLADAISNAVKARMLSAESSHL